MCQVLLYVVWQKCLGEKFSLSVCRDHRSWRLWFSFDSSSSSFWLCTKNCLHCCCQEFQVPMFPLTLVRRKSINCIVMWKKKKFPVRFSDVYIMKFQKILICVLRVHWPSVGRVPWRFNYEILGVNLFYFSVCKKSAYELGGKSISWFDNYSN